jgi:hypothetical protein
MKPTQKIIVKEKKSLPMTNLKGIFQKKLLLHELIS